MILERVIYETVIVEIWLGIRIEPNMEGNRKGPTIWNNDKNNDFWTKTETKILGFEKFWFRWKMDKKQERLENV